MNYEKGARTRAAITRLCAIRGVKVLDLQQVVGPILSGYLSEPTMDPYVRDNLHGTQAMNRVIARACANAVAARFFKKMTPAIALRSVPAGDRLTGWTGTQRFAVDSEGWLSMSGSLTAGTKTDGTVAFTLPISLRPSNTRVFYVPNDATTFSRVDVQSDGNVVIRQVGSANNLVLDGIKWGLSPL